MTQPDIVERIFDSLKVNPTYMLRNGDLAEAGSAIKHLRLEKTRLVALQASLIEALTNLLAQNKGPEWAWARLVLNEAVAHQQYEERNGR